MGRGEGIPGEGIPDEHVQRCQERRDPEDAVLPRGDRVGSGLERVLGVRPWKAQRRG